MRFFSNTTLENQVCRPKSGINLYPFGAPMPGRKFSSNSYKYGFNGKENDNETVGTGEGTQDYGMRIYNPALGRFLSVDPLVKQYPWYSPYQFAGNNPIRFIDLDGTEPEDPPAMWLQTNGSKDYGDYYKSGGNLLRVNDARTAEKYWVEQYSDANGNSAFYWYNGAEKKWQPFTPTGYTRGYLQEDSKQRDLGSENFYALADFFQKAVAVTTGVIVTAPILLEVGVVAAVGEGGVGTYAGTATLRMAVDASAQAVVNGPDNIDYADVVMSGFFTPGGSAIIGGGLDWKPFSSGEKFRVVGANKNVEEAVFDATAKYTFGRDGIIGSKVSQLGGSLGVPALSPIVQAPFNAAGKGVTSAVKKQVFGNGGGTNGQGQK